MQTEFNPLEIDVLVRQFFNVESITYGNEKQPFLVRYVGSFQNSDSTSGFNQLADALETHNLIPILQQVEDRQNLLILPKPLNNKKAHPRINLIMFLLTVISVLFTGGLYGYQGDLSGNTFQIIWLLIKSGWPFAVSLLLILSAHEFGHYFAGKRNGVDVTLPFFIPFPLSSFGTMGAFINMRSLPRTRKALFDIAIAGPISGLIVSIIVLLIGLNLSDVNTLPMRTVEGMGLQMEGSSLLYVFLKYVSFGELLPKLNAQNGLGLTAVWFQYFFTGSPFPWGAQDVMLHPVAWAGWAGLFVTAINLLPVGQLDGGHIFQTVFGKKAAKTVFPLIITGLVILGIFWNGWWLWAGILFFMGRRYAEPMDQTSKLDPKRKWLGYLAVFIFIITFIPVPITIV